MKIILLFNTILQQIEKDINEGSHSIILFLFHGKSQIVCANTIASFELQDNTLTISLTDQTIMAFNLKQVVMIQYLKENKI